MPIFVDRHSPAEAVGTTIGRLVLEARRRSVDAHGVRPVGYWLADGAIYCVLEGPNAEAIRQHHAARGLQCDDLHHAPRLAGLRGRLTAEDYARVRDEIARLWR